jgi:hypothetical protein
MFSNDRNIETIAQLVEAIKHYIGLQGEYVKLDVTDKIVRILTVFSMTVILSVLLAFILIYLSFAVAYALSPLLGTAGGFCAVALFYLIIFILFLFCRKKWIEKPLVRFLANILIKK